ncbi:MAG: HAMP domain-containing protein [Planctomycetota bacterium]|nr:MAG: HAMP domain-containing protein [Planctomycetota bacterium]
MIRRISTKWVLAVLGVVVVPFVGFALFVYSKVSDRLSDDVVRFHLLSVAADLADRIDSEIDERSLDVRDLAGEFLVENLLGDYLAANQPDRADRPDGAELPDWTIWHGPVETTFDRYVERTAVYDLVLAIDAEGRMLAHNSFRPDGVAYDPTVFERLLDHDFRVESWFRAAMEDGFARGDQHQSNLIPLALDDGAAHAENYHISFAGRVDRQGAPVGVVFLLMNWKHIQDAISAFGVRRLQGRGGGGPVVGEDIYKSSYAWIWKSDADTILAHPSRELYGMKVSEEPLNLPQMVARARSAAWGMYPDYEFQGVGKRAAFKWCKRPAEGGFGWVVGIGIDQPDIEAPLDELARLFFTSSAFVLTLAILWTFYIARRTTRPIRALEEHTRRIAEGDLDARIEVRSKDELGQLATSFNTMVARLKENREQLVKAEKDAAWREMARQVAHEIKNPLTPIALSVSLLKRSRDEHSPEFDRIFDRTMGMIQRQVDNMREIARDFYAFAGKHKEPQVVDLGAIVDSVLQLDHAWAEDQNVRIHRAGDGGLVFGDPDELERAFQNLVSNAIEAMPEGGDLHVTVGGTEREVTVEFRDTGKGLSQEVEGHLFEPYFTTRSSGTGLGLAIVRRVVTDMGGRVDLVNAPDGVGALARVTLPRRSTMEGR